MLSNDSAIETLLGWFNIQHSTFIYVMLLCDVCYLILCYIRINLFIFLLFSRCSLCDFTVWLQKNDFSFHKWSFHSNINIICRLICYWFFPFFCLVVGFLFMVDVFLCPACWNNKIFPMLFLAKYVSSIFLSQYQCGRPNGITEMMNNTFHLDYQIHSYLNITNTLIVIPDPQLNLFLNEP